MPSKRRSPWTTERPYPRTARLNELMREVLAEEIARLCDTDERFTLLTVTAVDADPDLRRAKVLFSSLTEASAAALEEVRVRLQAALGRQIRMKRTPQLAFAPDPAVAAGSRVEDILRSLDETGGGDGDGRDAQPGGGDHLGGG